MKRWKTDKCVTGELDGETTVKSKYFLSPKPSTKSPKEVNVESKTIGLGLRSVTNTTPIKSTDIPVPKKRSRTTRVFNPADTNESVFLRQVCGSLDDTRNSVEQVGKHLSKTPSLTHGLNRFGHGFYDVPCTDLARNLLGQVLVRRLDNGSLLRGRIVETECYLGGEDKASHSHNGKMTDRNTPMYMKPGTAYVYLTYGMYHCFNISSQGNGAAVLLRALDPLEGAVTMSIRRTHARPKTPITKDTTKRQAAKTLKTHELCSGPAKLCISLDIKKASCNRQDLSTWDGMWVEPAGGGFEAREHEVVKTQRIGIESAGVEWATKPLRFYLMDNKSVSRRDKIKERELKEIALLLG